MGKVISTISILIFVMLMAGCEVHDQFYCSLFCDNIM